MKTTILSKILEIRNITESTYILKLEKNNFEFSAGQYLALNVPGENKAREYSVYSQEQAPFIELLIKEVEKGEISKELKYLKVGTKVELTGPYGNFTLKDNEAITGQHFTFIATGTGIAPFHSIILSNPDIDYDLIHGVRYSNEKIIRATDYKSEHYKLCTSRVANNSYHGRVTQYIKTLPISLKTVYFVCGNSAMVKEITDYLKQKGVKTEKIRTEIFF